jgi:hypothetical protein
MKKFYSNNLLGGFIFTLFSTTIIYAQDVFWEKSFGGKQAEYLLDALPTPDYGFILAGSSLSDKSGNKEAARKGNYDYCLWKIRENGEIDWQKSFGGSKNDMLISTQTTKDGGYILAGTSDSPISADKTEAAIGQQDLWILRLDAAGNLLWQKTIGGLAEEQLGCILQTKEGGFVIGASSASDKYSTKKSESNNNTIYKNTDSRGNLDYWVLKLDKNGTLEWQKTIGGNYLDQLRSITQTSDGNYLVGGVSNSGLGFEKNQKSEGENDFWILKLDKKGNLIWQQTYGGKGDDQLYTIIETKDKNYVVAGNTNGATPKGNSPQGSDFMLLKLDESGAVLWEKLYNNGTDDVLTNLVKNNDETLLLCGYSRRNSKKKTEGTECYEVIKIDNNGEELWRKNVDKKGKNVLNKAIETRDGGYILAGTNSDSVTSDFWVVKLKDLKKPEAVKATIEAFPNPASSFTNVIIGFEYTSGTASLYDLAGRELQRFPITSRTVPIDLSGLPEGIYIVNIATNNGHEGIKVIKQEIKN